MIARLLFLTLCSLPAVALAGGAPTGTDSDSDSATDTATDTGMETSTMPPKYEACGCRSDQLGAGWTLALTGLGLWALRRRRS